MSRASSASKLLFGPSGDYTLTDPAIPNFPVYTSASGRTLVDPVIREKTLIFVVAGQSNAANHDDATYSVTNTLRVQNLSIYDGNTYLLESPLIGCTYRNGANNANGSSWQGRLGDKIINAGWAARVIFVPIAVAGTAISAWASGGSMNHRWAVTGNRLNDRAMLGSVSAVLWQQGESDNTAGTTQNQYETRFASVLSSIRAARISAPVFVAQCTRQNDGSTSTAVRAAQAAVVNHGSGVWAGPDSDSNANRDSAAHFDATGSDTNASAWLTALGLYGAPFST